MDCKYDTQGNYTCSLAKEGFQTVENFSNWCQGIHFAEQCKNCKCGVDKKNNSCIKCSCPCNAGLQDSFHNNGDCKCRKRR